MNRQYKVLIIVLCLCALLISISWLATGWVLETTQRTNIIKLEGENELCALSLEKAQLQISIANATIIEQNGLLADYTEKTRNLEQMVETAKNQASTFRLGGREFDSLEELETWLAEDDSDTTIYIYGFGCLSTYDCDDYAVALMKNARQDGYLISMQFTTERGKCHALNSTMIGNEVYFIEPQTDEVWFWSYRD